MANKPQRTTFDLKSINLPLLTFDLKSADLAMLDTEMTRQFGKQSDYFDSEPAIITLSSLPPDTPALDFAALLQLLLRFKLVPFAVRCADPAQIVAAQSAGLMVLPQQETPVAPADDSRAATTVTAPAPQTASPGVMVVDKPLRSGQQVYARGGDLIITSLVSFGAEVIADGNIHVYAPLRGRAIAGAQGNTSARIYTTCFEPELYAIAGVYRTTEKTLPPEVKGKPVVVSLQGDALVVTPIAGSSHSEHP